ncbi:methylamine utilization protein [Pseudoalteromonas shioyasakiensis]|uniref:methylamine utilization protein n=1 Tax=Pseudoalteromonas shioyasakiensis TaxID=1190813 RepID=UPI0021195F68|nr:methylamine utilization protein [Pseudoalteromonas shioyasakiensis]MCQ8879809.1 methylamine utilization protein [Pseudoalteromonas shioyasakiensis]
MKLFSLLLLAFITVKSYAVTVTIADLDQQAVANAVVWLTPLQPLESKVRPNQSFTMSQKDRQFTPHVLVVEQNAEVEFPNLDSIMHHVYSFSKSKSFELKLYREQPKAPITFEQTGVVELGCNIHDWMLGYIVVVDSPFYGITNEQGKLSFDAPSGDYTLNVWHEGFNDISLTESQRVKIADTALQYQLKQQLIPRIMLGVDEFDEY